MNRISEIYSDVALLVTRNDPAGKSMTSNDISPGVLLETTLRQQNKQLRAL